MKRTTDGSPRQRRALAPLAARLISLLGCALTLQATPAAAQLRRPVPPSRGARPAAPPWSEGSGISPLPFPRAQATASPARHPAIHGRPGDSPLPPHRLFPRAADITEEKRRRDEAMERHPAGKGRPSSCAAKHPVRRGDTLWGIAAASTDTDDPASILAATQQIYAANRATIGDDPDLILPGQILSLPGDCDR